MIILDRFSFGDPHGSIIQPLEGDEKITDNGKTAFQLYNDSVEILNICPHDPLAKVPWNQLTIQTFF